MPYKHNSGKLEDISGPLPHTFPLKPIPQYTKFLLDVAVMKPVMLKYIASPPKFYYMYST